MGKRMTYSLSGGTQSQIPAANEKPYIVNQTARHNYKHLEETTPKPAVRLVVKENRLRRKNEETDFQPEPLHRPPSKKNISNPFRGEAHVTPIAGKNHVQEPSPLPGKRPIRAIPGGTTAGGYMDVRL
jgi:hypothetical protein